MVPIDAKQFLDELAALMAAAAGITYAAASESAKKDLFRNELVDAAANDPASVLRIYDDAVPFVPADELSIQCMTTGTQNDATHARAIALFQSLFSATTKRPLNNVNTAHYKIILIDNLRGPGLIGRDDKNRSQWAFNFTADAVSL